MLSLLVLAAGLALILGGAELFFAGVLAAAGRLRVSAFVLTVVVSGSEREKPAAGRFPLVRVAAGLALLSGGGEVLGEGIRRVVSHLGISDTLLGNTAIAASVEAEEIGRVAVPARRGRGDLALGNVLGT